MASGPRTKGPGLRAWAAALGLSLAAAGEAGRRSPGCPPARRARPAKGGGRGQEGGGRDGHRRLGADQGGGQSGQG